MFDEDVRIGESLSTFMESINSVDGIIILFTTEYKQRVLNRIGGVYSEYSDIIKRCLNIDEGGRGDNPSIFPILFSGDEDASVPDEILEYGYKYADFRRFRSFKNNNNEYVVTKQIEREYFRYMKEIVDQLFATHSYRSPGFVELQERWFRTLFLRKKHEWQGSNLEFDYVVEQKIFVETYSYQRVLEQTTPILIGRKGSGKSSVSYYISKSTSYKAPILINVDSFKLEHIYSFFGNRQIRSDINNILSNYDMFCYAWELFIYVCCMESMVIENNCHKLSAAEADKIDFIYLFLENIQNIKIDRKSDRSFLDYPALFDYCLSMFKLFIDDAIHTARNDRKYFLSDVKRLTTLKKFVEKSIDDNVYSAFQSHMTHGSKRFLFSLDGFDSGYDDFRKTTIINYDGDEYRGRILLEMTWLRALIETVIRIKSNHQRSNFYSRVDFCVTIPKDRFSEVRNFVRDAYNLYGRYIDINWTGTELAQLIRKRLEVLKGFRSNDEKMQHERLAEIMQNEYPNIPVNITVKLNESKNCTMPLFLYILRHTFWRPRDVLFYYANILAVSEELVNKKLEVSEESVKRVVSETTRTIIETEFINEYESTIRNIRELVAAFDHSNQVISYNDIYDKIGKIEINRADQLSDDGAIDSKILLLYDIGFIGIVCDEESDVPFNFKFSFYFNEGDAQIGVGGRGHFRDKTFVIHPIFCEYLHLKAYVEELVLNYNWDYIYKNEIYRFSTM